MPQVGPSQIDLSQLLLILLDALGSGLQRLPSGLQRGLKHAARSDADSDRSGVRTRGICQAAYPVDLRSAAANEAWNGRPADPVVRIENAARGDRRFTVMPRSSASGLPTAPSIMR